MSDAREQKKILVVDDDISLLNAIGERIGSLGHHILVTDKGKEALEVIKTNKIDILLTDVVMPDISGIELARILLNTTPDSRVIFMSGYMRPSLFSEEAGAKITDNDFIQKPFSGKTVVKRVKKALEELTGSKK